MLYFAPDHLKTKKICRRAVKKVTILTKYVPDRCKTQQVGYKVIIKNGGMLIFIPDQV